MDESREEFLNIVNEIISLIRENALKRLMLNSIDEIIVEKIIPDEESKQINNSYTELIRWRAKELAAQYKEHENLFENYVKKQEDECKIIESTITGCIWCLQKKSKS
jgi:hypothetical protein